MLTARLVQHEMGVSIGMFVPTVVAEVNGRNQSSRRPKLPINGNPIQSRPSAPRAADLPVTIRQQQHENGKPAGLRGRTLHLSSNVFVSLAGPWIQTVGWVTIVAILTTRERGS